MGWEELDKKFKFIEEWLSGVWKQKAGKQLRVIDACLENC